MSMWMLRVRGRTDSGRLPSTSVWWVISWPTATMAFMGLVLLLHFMSTGSLSGAWIVAVTV